MRIMGVFLLVMAMAAAGCQRPIHQNLPPSQMVMHPGPGVDGPGPGVMTYQPPAMPIGAVSQLYFVGPEGITIHWDVTAPGRFDSEPLIAPARYNFPQGAMYRLKLANIPGRPGVELYPTIELAFAMPRTEAFLAHNAIPIELTEEDFDQVTTGNFVTKVIYLPDPEFQELALQGVGTLVSTRLDPGVDPIVEADRRGAILAIVRIGNKDMQLPSAGTAAAEAAAGQMGGYGPPCPMPGYAGGMPQYAMPQYGMPITGTPIGLPGPPHVPLGVPAGLQNYTIVNHTHVCVPGPEASVRIDVKQKPGISYPAPANHARIVEHACVGHEGCPQQCPAGGPCPADACPVDGNAQSAPGANTQATAVTTAAAPAGPSGSVTK
jgi:hypothetical protein